MTPLVLAAAALLVVGWVVRPILGPATHIVPTDGSTPVCPKCGPRPESDARYCSECGARTTRRGPT